MYYTMLDKLAHVYIPISSGAFRQEDDDDDGCCSNSFSVSVSFFILLYVCVH